MKEKNSKEKWLPTNKRFVAFLDILGFKDKVLRNDHIDVYNELKLLSDIHKSLDTLLSKTSYSGMLNFYDIYVVNFSDSIIIFTKNDSIQCLETLLYSLKYIFTNSIENNIAIKGGIAHGNITVNKNLNLFVGQPIIDAYLLEEEVNYLGATCHHSIDAYLEINKPSTLVDLMLFEHKTPLKTGMITHKNLDWFYNLSKSFEEDGIDQIESSIRNSFKNLYPTVSGNPRRYIDNSIELMEKLIKSKNMNIIPII